MKKTPPSAAFTAFKKRIWSHYRAHKRSMPWRDDVSLYYVIVSEIMLQQTQVSRVLVKFAPFVKRFPDWQALAKAPTRDVLREWSGLGYNRRALYLKRIAQTIIERREDGRSRKDPMTYEELLALPGIGPNTAGSILAFAYNVPRPFIETNIRSVFIRSFFAQSEGKVADADILPLLERCLADPYVRTHAREWYWALMDYGAYLKQTYGNPSRKSAHHARQSPFAGSNRELRSKILRTVLKKARSEETIVLELGPGAAARIRENIRNLVREGFLEKRGSVCRIASRRYILH